MGDDGLGVSVVQTVKTRWGPDPGLAFLDGGTWGMQVLPFIEEADRLLIIDAIKAGEEAGSLVRLEDEEIPRHLHQKLSPHQIDLGEVLALAQLRGTFPARAVALGIEPDRIELHEGFSDVVERSVPGLVAAVVAQLVAWGHAPGGSAGIGSEEGIPADGAPAESGRCGEGALTPREATVDA